MSEKITLEILAERFNNLTETVKNGFEGVHTRQDKTNGRINVLENENLKRKDFQSKLVGAFIFSNIFIIPIIVAFIIKMVNKIL